VTRPRTGIELADVQGAVDDLRARGRTLITSKDVCDELGTDQSGGTRSRVGALLNDCAGVELASDRGSQNSYRIPANQPVRADGGEQA